MELMSNMLIQDVPKKSNSITILLSQYSYESEEFLTMEIDMIEKHFMGSQYTVHDFSHFKSPSFSLGVSQEKKQVLPKGVILVDLEPNISTLEVQVLNYDVEDVLTICVMSPAYCISTPLLGTSSCSLMDDFLFLFHGSK